MRHESRERREDPAKRPSEKPGQGGPAPIERSMVDAADFIPAWCAMLPATATPAHLVFLAIALVALLLALVALVLALLSRALALVSPVLFVFISVVLALLAMPMKLVTAIEGGRSCNAL